MPSPSQVPAVRHGFHVLVKVILADGPPHLGSMEDLSESGMRLDVPVPLGLGDRVRLRFFLPGGRGAVDLAGEVVRSVGRTEAGHRVGVRFVDLAAEAAEQIGRFLAGRKPKAAVPDDPKTAARG